MTSSHHRLLALTLLAGFLVLPVLPLVEASLDSWSETSAVGLAAVLALLFVPWACFLGLILQLRLLALRAPEESGSARRVFWLGGPFGVVWKIFDLTRG